MKNRVISKGEMIWLGFFVTYEILKFGRRKYTRIIKVQAKVEGKLELIEFEKPSTLKMMERELDTEFKLNGKSFKDKILNTIENMEFELKGIRPYEA